MQSIAHDCPNCTTPMGYLFDIDVWECPACHYKVSLGNVHQPQYNVKYQHQTYGRYVTYKKSTMTPQPTIRIWWDVSVTAYRITSPYNKQLVDALKTKIPASDRHYDEVTKTWTIVERQFAPLDALLKFLDLKCVIITRQQAEAAASTSSSTSTPATRGRPLDAVIIEFVRLLPYDAAKTAYRKAAMDLHPDKQSGDSSKMTSLNAAWDRIAKEVYGQ